MTDRVINGEEQLAFAIDGKADAITLVANRSVWIDWNHDEGDLPVPRGRNSLATSGAARLYPSPQLSVCELAWLAVKLAN